MTKDNYLKQEADRLMKIKGNVKGAVFFGHAAYVRYKEEEKGIKAIEDKLKELGHPLKFKEVKELDWYPEALSVLIIITAKEIFNWKDSDIFEMGNFAPKNSFIARLLMKYFLSLKKVFKECPKYWQKHFNFGEMKSCEINEKKKYIVFQIKGYKFHPLICIYLAGYFLRVAQFVIKSKNITIKEIKCVFKGDPYDEYIINWE